MTATQSDSFAAFHPVVRRWWRERFAQPDGGHAPPTPAQVRGWASIRSGENTLIAAPTGSGKTLAAFLNAIDSLFREGLDHDLPDEVRVVYVSPLKALSADIHKNLAEPRREIRQLAESLGLPQVRISAAVRTGDTPQSERAAMLRTPPHILVTTPESLYLLLTADRSRKMLRTVRTVIVDEIHAVIESRRGAHLALSLERLDHVASRSVQRIGLSATQKPIEEVAAFLVGAAQEEAALSACAATPARPCGIVDEGHVRALDLDLELPGSALEAVMAAEVWQEVFERIVQLVASHRTTLVFVNTRRLAERVARALGERLGEDAVAAHHGSLARDVRQDAEERLKSGRLRALVATASLELGIDIGHVDLVIQLGSPRRIAAFLQRVGRSGHTVHGTPKGRLFPLTRDDLVECTALLGAVRHRELDRVILPVRPLDVLAQQVIAETAAEDWDEGLLFERFRRAWPYRTLGRGVFDEIVAMVSRGFATRRGRRGALVHHDAVNHRLRGRKGTRMVAITSGGAIPEIADYRVELEPEGTLVGTLNEDFAVESAAGDVFQLGNTSWRILRIETGVVRVADAHGEPPTIPFWLGEAPARSDELSAAVSRLREDIEHSIVNAGLTGTEDASQAAREAVVSRLGIPVAAAEQIIAYLGETRRLLGVVPTQETLVLERFFDEAGGMQLVLHAPFGARVNRAWGLALRKKFCRTFNFELQAAATDEGLVLSLGPQHSFPLDDVFRYLHPNTLRDTLVQAMLDAPLFQTRWRWNTTLSLAVQRSRNGRKVPPQLQRMQAEDLLAAVFPDAAACFENIEGERQVPEHPLVHQVIDDCLVEAMDLARLDTILRRIFAGELTLLARDVPEPSPMTHEILNARPYAFLDDAPLEERRTQAVYTRRALEPSSANDLGALDSEAIERVRREAWPEAASADELHDALLTSGFLCDAEFEREPAWSALFEPLAAARRVTRVAGMVTAVERLPELMAVLALESADAAFVPESYERAWSREDALRELVRSRLEILGPVTLADLAAPLGASPLEIETALIAIEAEGFVMRGTFTPGRTLREWCERRLLARIHRYTLNRLRAEIQPVSPAVFMRFLFRWQHVTSDAKVAGLDGLMSVIEQLDGFEVPAAAWEADVLPARCADYAPELVDMLCLSGRIGWGRISTPANGSAARPIRSSPVALFPRGSSRTAQSPQDSTLFLSTHASDVRDALTERGASFFHEIVVASGLLPTQVEQALAELVAAGLATADSFAGLRALLTPSSERAPIVAGPRRRRTTIWSVDTAGRWSLLGEHPAESPGTEPALRRAAAESLARSLLRRWGVVFRKLVERESGAVSWRETALACRRMEARGEIRGGRFVSGFAGEQFALPEAVGMLRSVRRDGSDGTLVTIGAADPLNLTGIITPEERVPAIARNRVLYRDGSAVAALEAGTIRWIARPEADAERRLEQALVRRTVPPQLRQYLRGQHRPGRKRRVGAPGESDGGAEVDSEPRGRAEVLST
ncbi:MAG: DEAD/DEAH box helicase [Longimicrobiales bacterium]